MRKQPHVLPAAAIVFVLVAIGCDRVAPPASPSPSFSPTAVSARVTEQARTEVEAQLVRIENLITAANQQLEIWLAVNPDGTPRYPELPPNPIHTPPAQALDFYLKANGALDALDLTGLPPNPILPQAVRNAASATLTLLVGSCDTCTIRPSSFYPAIIAEAEHTIAVITPFVQ